ncbi:MAG: peptide chain release factor-like protein [Candidatus Magnetoovum sp. WYHC-5]|nr:peptide chain release factor-like protein [Candidatus Magnetoovum sp. WYHC-5]
MVEFAVTPEKNRQLIQRFEELNIKEEDIEEKFIRGSGHGGQKINKTSSTVYLKHIPTGIEVKCSKERSQSVNRFLARRLLAEKIECLLYKKESSKEKAISKIRKQKQKRKKRGKLQVENL